MACSKLEARGHLLHEAGTPPKHISRECNRTKSQSWTFFEYTPCTVLPRICKIERSSSASGCTQTRFEYVPYFVLSDKNEHCFLILFKERSCPVRLQAYIEQKGKELSCCDSAQCFGKPLFFPVLILTYFWSDFCAFSFLSWKRNRLGINPAISRIFYYRIQKFVKTGTGKNIGFPEHCALTLASYRISLNKVRGH